MERQSAWSDDQLMQQLRNLVARNPTIEGAAVVTIDGVHIASILPPSVNHIHFIAADCAILTSLTVKLLKGIDQKHGNKAQIYIKGSYGYATVLSIEHRLLITLCKEHPQSGLIDLGGRSPAHDPIIPSRPPGKLTARAEPEYDEE